VVQVRPNWIARISAASVALLLLFFAATQYESARETQHQFDVAASDRAKADSDRRIALQALAATRKAQDDASAARASALQQNSQLIEITLTLEDQLVRLGVTPVVQKNSILKLRALAPASTAANPPTLGPSGSASSPVPPSMRRSVSAAPPGPPAGGGSPRRPTPAPTGTGSPGIPTPSPSPPPVPVVPLPSLGITACVIRPICVGL
jgi:hypothetical protein